VISPRILHALSDNMIAGRENGHFAVANVGYARVSTVDQDPAFAPKAPQAMFRGLAILGTRTHYR
jgi:hypothetical protein